MDFIIFPGTDISKHFGLPLNPELSAEVTGQTTIRKHTAHRIGLAISFLKQIQKYLREG